VFDGYAINRLRVIFAKVCADFEAQLIEMDGEDDHVHLLVEQIRRASPDHNAARRLVAGQAAR
jgi:putative transposase